MNSELTKMRKWMATSSFLYIGVTILDPVEFHSSDIQWTW